MDEAGDPIAVERAAYLELSAASIDATLDAAAIRDEPSSPAQAARLLAAMRHMVELQAAVLAAHDRVVVRSQEFGADWRTLAQLREGRADLVLGLQQTTAAVRRHEAT